MHPCHAAVARENPDEGGARQRAQMVEEFFRGGVGDGIADPQLLGSGGSAEEFSDPAFARIAAVSALRLRNGDDELGGDRGVPLQHLRR